ncbi:hypothetical protein [Kitasatospora sp. GP82]|uniref:hypothetical protein n=1 Tax=Kitasatospora sp. GP82 TaxID=3035089 RepID=UPI0024748D28|nr:hypothetical protein [Kitasatospora sp. GP82]
MLDEAGRWWARHEVKPGKKAPDGYLLMETDEVTGKTVGWEPVSGSPFARFHAEAVGDGGPVDPGTYELLGPKINGNPDGFAVHVLMPHGWEPLSEYSVPGTAEAAGTGRASARVRVVAVRPAEQAVARSVRRVGFPLV